MNCFNDSLFNHKVPKFMNIKFVIFIDWLGTKLCRWYANNLFFYCNTCSLCYLLMLIIIKLDQKNTMFISH